MAVEGHLAIVDGLLALPLAEGDGFGHHVRVLQATQDFWDDRSPEAVEAAEEQIDASLQALADVLTARWGAPERVDLDPYLWGEEPAPEPMAELCQLSSVMLVWWPPTGGRWVALSVGQADPEFPVELRVAMSDVPLHGSA
ncbi:hypothetical protein [Actinomadura hibisca]|uniref:hypothetical protein n=1 Tax=Actinomadura hibisca TaxID=68565 RepID=UPI000829C299|nr:hypothetical protein [Actinomadura hibisca]